MDSVTVWQNVWCFWQGNTLNCVLQGITALFCRELEGHSGGWAAVWLPGMELVQSCAVSGCQELFCWMRAAGRSSLSLFILHLC